MPPATSSRVKPSPRAHRAVHLLRRWWWAAAAIAVVVAAVLTWSLWPSPQPQEPPRARQYLDFTACLLTGERGIAETVAAPVWAGMQDASFATHAKVQYLAITGPQTIDNGITFLNSLAQSGCDMIYAAGEIPVATVDKGAPQFPGKKFFPTGAGAPQRNVTPIQAPTPDGIRTVVAATLTAGVGAGATT